MWKISVTVESGKFMSYGSAPGGFRTKNEAWFVACRMAEVDYLRARNEMLRLGTYEEPKVRYDNDWIMVSTEKEKTKYLIYES